MIPEEKIVHIDVLPLYKKYTDVFLMDDVPEDERKTSAREVADKMIATLDQAGEARWVAGPATRVQAAR